jgi:Predicted archaeal kinase
VYDRQQNVIDKITAYEPIKDAVGSAQQTDVTGGMAMKVRSLLHLETNSHIFDTSQLADFLQGQSVGTTICTEQ